MAQIRLISWNIQVYGPEKFALTPNNVLVAELACRTILASGATVVVLMELISSVAGNIAGTFAVFLAQLSGNPWNYYVTPARPAGDRESYAILWRAGGVNFAPIAGAEGLALEQAVAYADSTSDLPMLEAVGFPVAVNPETRLAAVARKRGWLVEHWAKAGGASSRPFPFAPVMAERARRRVFR